MLIVLARADVKRHQRYFHSGRARGRYDIAHLARRRASVGRRCVSVRSFVALCATCMCTSCCVCLCVCMFVCGHSVTLIFSFRQFARLESERVALADAQGHWRRDVSLHQSRVGLRGGGRQGRQRRLRNGV